MIVYTIGPIGIMEVSAEIIDGIAFHGWQRFEPWQPGGSLKNLSRYYFVDVISATAVWHMYCRGRVAQLKAQIAALDKKQQNGPKYRPINGGWRKSTPVGAGGG